MKIVENQNNQFVLLRIDEAAELLRVAKQTLYQWKSEGKIPFVKVNGRLLFEQSKLLKYAMGEE